MTLFTKSHLQDLLARRHAFCVSIFLPTERAAPESHQNPVRFRNLLKQAETQLLQRGCRQPEVVALLAPAAALLADSIFWTHQQEGLAVFVAEGFQREFRVPQSFQEQVWVDDHFHVRPLLSLLRPDGRFYVLAISENSCRFLTGDRDGLEEAQILGLPANMQVALERWRELSQQPQRPDGGDQIAFGGEVGTRNAALLAYFRLVNDAIVGELGDDRAPIIFAGTPKLFPMFQQQCQLTSLLGMPLATNPDDVTLDELHQRACKLAQPWFKMRLQHGLEEFPIREASGRATTELPLIMTAAHDGLIDTLLVADDAHCWGRFDPAHGSCEVHPERQPDDIDLVDEAVQGTLTTDGSVLTVQRSVMPAGAPVAAALRAPAKSLVRA